MGLDEELIRVGYLMKPSWRVDFIKRGIFPDNPTENALVFIPITLDCPLAPQLEKVDAILHKATDEIVSVDANNHAGFARGITFSKGMQELFSYLQEHPDCCVIDPLDNIYSLLDRHMTQNMLLGLEDICSGSLSKIRAPHCLRVESFEVLNLRQKLLQSQLPLPAIVKPQVACGVSGAHSMQLEDFACLPVPTPAIIQEYIDHGSIIYKFYVLGDAIFHAVRTSTPNAAALLSSAKSGTQSVIFDSLKNLPTVTETSCSQDGKQALDHELVSAAATWLKRKLGLTIFGFDVVIQSETGDHVIVDVNYLPSFKEVPDDVAVPAFWEAIKRKYMFQLVRNESGLFHSLNCNQQLSRSSLQLFCSFPSQRCLALDVKRQQTRWEMRINLDTFKV